MIGGGIGGVTSLVQVELRTYGIFRIETEVHGQCFAQATQRDKRSGDCDAAKRDLCRQQNVAKGPATSSGGLNSAALDRFVGIGLEYLPQRHHSEENAREHRD